MPLPLVLLDNVRWDMVKNISIVILKPVIYFLWDSEVSRFSWISARTRTHARTHTHTHTHTHKEEEEEEAEEKMGQDTSTRSLLSAFLTVLFLPHLSHLPSLLVTPPLQARPKTPPGDCISMYVGAIVSESGRRSEGMFELSGRVLGSVGALGNGLVVERGWSL